MAGIADWPRSVVVSGIRLDPRSIQEAAWEICDWVERGDHGYVVTTNTQHLDLYQTNLEFREAYDAARLRVIDGRPIRWLARIKTSRSFPMCSGSDLIWPLCTEAASRGLSVGVVAASEGIARETVALLNTREPVLRVAGAWAAPLALRDNEHGARELAAAISAKAPDILFIGVGAPTQELWARSYAHRCGAGAVLCIGAGLEFLIGRKRRAPRWVRRLGFEAAWRLMCEPRRLWRRYMGAAVATGRAYRSALIEKRTSR